MCVTSFFYTCQNMRPINICPIFVGRCLSDYGFGWRHVITCMLFFGANVLYMLRVNMSIALVAMVNQTAVLDAAIHGGDSSGAAVCQLVNENDRPFGLTNETRATDAKYVCIDAHSGSPPVRGTSFSAMQTHGKTCTCYCTTTIVK